MPGNDKDFIIDPRLAGLSGDMLLSALAAVAGENSRVAFNEFAKDMLNGVGLQKNTFEIREVSVSGFAGYQVYQNFQEDLEERTFDAIRGHFRQIFALGKLSERSVSFCEGTLDLLISAEARVHGKSASDGTSHLHELGSVDTAIDICGVAFLLDQLKAWNCQFIALPLNTGSGKVIIDHGHVSVPAPAVVEILNRYRIPFFSDGTPAELVTPTGVALLAKLVSRVEPDFPLFQSDNYGVGHGTRKTNKPNYLRIYSGKVLGTEPLTGISEVEQVVVLETHVDDVSGEVIGSIFDPLFNSGALDVTAFPFIAKKNRPGWCLRIVAKPEDTELLAMDLVKHLRTLGVRFYVTKRYVIPRQIKLVKISIRGNEHEVHLKQAGPPERPLFFKIEFEDLQRIARIYDMSVQEVNDMITAQMLESRGKGENNGN
ncbi:MAG: nickel pincer cofactor biosynthesis protein LarC [Candidatus Odinarchaeota archaeon]